MYRPTCACKFFPHILTPPPNEPVASVMVDMVVGMDSGLEVSGPDGPASLSCSLMVVDSVVLYAASDSQRLQQDAQLGTRGDCYREA